MSEWISVEARLPDHKQRVNFVIDSATSPFYKHLHGKVLGGQYDEDSERFSVPGCGFQASHWMLSPEPPK